MQKTLLITGTAAGVGKTVVTLAIAAYCQTFAPQRRLAVFKPVDAGSADAARYRDVLKLDLPPEAITPCALASRSAPPLAAEQGEPMPNLADIWRRYQTLLQEHDLVLMEACGGLGTPLNWETTIADLAWDWRLPTLLVVPIDPGAIAQAIAHVALARQSRVHLKGVILNSLHPQTPDEMAIAAATARIQSLLQIPILGHLPHLENPYDLDKLAHIASALNIERILPFL